MMNRAVRLILLCLLMLWIHNPHLMQSSNLLMWPGGLAVCQSKDVRPSGFQTQTSLFQHTENSLLLRDPDETRDREARPTKAWTVHQISASITFLQTYIITTHPFPIIWSSYISSRDNKPHQWHFESKKDKNKHVIC